MNRKPKAKPQNAIVKQSASEFLIEGRHQSYRSLLNQLKARIQAARTRAVLAVNRELVLLYWHIGRDIIAALERERWGAKVVDRLAGDLRRAFPDMKGFSRTNLKYMRRFAEAYPDLTIGQQVVDQLPWGHNIVLLEQVGSPAERLWYAEQTIEYGWSRNVLVHQIESGLHLRQGQAVTNFEHTLPAPQSDLAQQLLKDPYNFDFLSLGREAQERELHRSLL